MTLKHSAETIIFSEVLVVNRLTPRSPLRPWRLWWRRSHLPSWCQKRVLHCARRCSSFAGRINPPAGRLSELTLVRPFFYGLASRKN